MKLENKIILITGESRAIGLELVQQLQRLGITVSVAGAIKQDSMAPAASQPACSLDLGEVRGENDIGDCRSR